MQSFMNRTSRNLFRGALAALLLSIQTVWAYYDPGVQRWINRDPVGEPGFARTGRAETRREAGQLYRAMRNDPIGVHDAFGLVDLDPRDWSYGRYCGFYNSGPGKPIDEVDAACALHDACLATWADALTPCKMAACNKSFCIAVGAANCSKSPDPAACRKAKASIGVACAATGHGLDFGVGWVWGIWR